MAEYSILDVLRDKQRRLEELRKEADQLEAELAKARALLGIPQAGGKPRRVKSRHGFTHGVRTRPIKNGSSVDWAKKALQDAKSPLHIDSLIAVIVAMGGPEVKKATLASNLSRYVVHHDTFTRPQANTFGLIEWGETA